MRRATFRELGLSWTYIFIPTIFLVLSCCSWGLSLYQKEDRMLGLTSGALFSTLFLCSFFFPLWRVREKQQVLFEHVRSDNLIYDSIYFPISKAKQYVSLLGSFMIAGSCVGLFLAAENVEYQIKAGIGALFFGGFFALWGKGLIERKQGIFLTKNGLIWHEMMRAPYFIPWNELVEVELFQKKEKNIKPVPTIGIRVRDPNRIKTTPKSRSKLSESKLRHGWDLYYFAETILVPLKTVTALTQFYWKNESARSEIGHQASLIRVAEFEQFTRN